MCVSVVCPTVPQQRTWGSQLYPYTNWFPETEVRSPSLEASTNITHWAILLGPNFLIKQTHLDIYRETLWVVLVNDDETPRTGGCKKYTVAHAGRTAGKLLVYANGTLDWYQMLLHLAKLLVGNRICLTDTGIF